MRMHGQHSQTAASLDEYNAPRGARVIGQLRGRPLDELRSLDKGWPRRRSEAGIGFDSLSTLQRRFPRASEKPACSSAAIRDDAFDLRSRNNSKQREFVLKEIQEDEGMTRSVNELRRESERSRAELAATVDQLRARISDTAEDIRHKVSPQHIKSEVSDYISHKSRSWVESGKQQAMENPMQAIVAATAVAVPVLRLARGRSLPPLLMIGAGLALTSKTVRDRAAEAAAPAMDKTRDMLDAAAARAQALARRYEGRPLVGSKPGRQHGQ